MCVTLCMNLTSVRTNRNVSNMSDDSLYRWVKMEIRLCENCAFAERTRKS